MKPFAMDRQNNSEAVSTGSSVLEAPAGQAGVIAVRNGHPAYPDGRRFRIWSVNITGPGNLPSHGDASIEAAHLVRFGAPATPWYRITGTQTTRSTGNSRSK
jgi:hypothetical protein